MVEQGHELLGAALELARDVRQRVAQIPDIDVMEEELLGVQGSHDLDRLQVLMDIAATGTSGYQGVDWIRENCQLDLGEPDHSRKMAKFSFADANHTADWLLNALTAWRQAAREIRSPAPDRLAITA